MRIVSLLPSATEIVCAIGLSKDLIGVSHACDYPPEAIGKPKVTRAADARGAIVDPEQAWAALDLGRIEALQPDLVLAPRWREGPAALQRRWHEQLRALPSKPRVLSLGPTYLADVLSTIKTVGDFTDRQREARKLVTALRAQADRTALQTARVITRPLVLCLECLDPPWVAGQWVPEMVGLAGGIDVLSTAGLPSQQVSWDEIAHCMPDFVVVMPRGLHLGPGVEQIRQAAFPPSWYTLTAVREGRLWAVNSAAYFAHPGPRLFTGLRVLGKILHPTHVRDRLPGDGAMRLS